MLDLDQLQKIVSNFYYGLGIGGIIGGFIGYYLKGLVNQHFQRSNISYTSKRNFAKQIIAICAEGDSNNYQKFPRDKEHIVWLTHQAGIYNSDLEEMMTAYEATWWIAATIFNKNPKLIESIELYRSSEIQAVKLSQKIRKIANKWLK